MRSCGDRLSAFRLRLRFREKDLPAARVLEETEVD
jgi:hypothetical protein